MSYMHSNHGPSIPLQCSLLHGYYHISVTIISDYMTASLWENSISRTFSITPSDLSPCVVTLSQQRFDHLPCSALRMSNYSPKSAAICKSIECLFSDFMFHGPKSPPWDPTPRYGPCQRETLVMHNQMPHAPNLSQRDVNALVCQLQATNTFSNGLLLAL